MAEPRVDDAIVTTLVAYGEADLVVRLFTRTGGRLGTFARGAKKSKKRFAGGLQPLARGRFTFRPRPGSDLALLEEADLAEDPARLARDPECFGRASYLVELVDRLLPEGEPAPGVYDELCLALEVLARGEGDARLLRAFELRLMADGGWLPDLSGAADEPGEPVVAWDPARGELLAHPTPGSVPFGEDAQRAALALLEAPLDGLPEVPEPTLRVVSRLFAGHLRRLQVGPLKSVAWLKGLAGPRPS